MEFYRMDYTLSTFLPECSLSQEPKTKDQIEKKIGLPPSDNSMPVLMHLLMSFMKGIKTSNPEYESSAPPESPVQPPSSGVPVPGNMIPESDFPEKIQPVQADELSVEEKVESKEAPQVQSNPGRLAPIEPKADVGSSKPDVENVDGSLGGQPDDPEPNVNDSNDYSDDFGSNHEDMFQPDNPVPDISQNQPGSEIGSEFEVKTSTLTEEGYMNIEPIE